MLITYANLITDAVLIYAVSHTNKAGLVQYETQREKPIAC